jgi:hypothetical protein
MFAQLVSTYHLHPVVDHFTIALLTFGIAAEILSSATVLISRGRDGPPLLHAKVPARSTQSPGTKTVKTLKRLARLCI